MSKPKYQKGDQVTVKGSKVEILEVIEDDNFSTSYLVKLLSIPTIKYEVSEGEIDCPD